MAKENDHFIIMVVDDEQHVRDTITRTLRRKGFTVIPASSGEEALCKASLVEIDMAFVDIRMPGMSGLELLATLRAKHPKLTVVMLTAINGVQAQTEANNNEAFGYLLKPFNLTDITGIVEKFIASREEDETSPELSPSSLASIPG